MADLYTDLRALKMAMNGGVMPPMTRLPPDTPEWIDPAFVPGLGALCETEADGLRCPVRGCGKWFHGLTRHITHAHPHIGAAAIKRALSIPRPARLISSHAHAVRVAANEQDGGARLRHARAARAVGYAERLGRSGGPRSSLRHGADYTMGMRNLRNRCEAQLRHALIDLQHQLGRSPTMREAEVALPPGTATFVRRAYGSWNAAKAQFGLEISRRQRKYGPENRRDAVLEALRAYYEAHHCLPSSRTFDRPRSLPLLPSRSMVAQAFGVSFPDAMRRAAALLNIYGGRYGLPESARPKQHQAA